LCSYEKLTITARRDLTLRQVSVMCNRISHIWRLYVAWSGWAFLAILKYTMVLKSIAGNRPKLTLSKLEHKVRCLFNYNKKTPCRPKKIRPIQPNFSANRAHIWFIWKTPLDVWLIHAVGGYQHGVIVAMVKAMWVSQLIIIMLKFNHDYIN
jgi:hypothetical protein